MITKHNIVENWLPRYTGTKLEDFGEYILLTNFSKYVNMFAERNKVEIQGKDKPMPSATSRYNYNKFWDGKCQCSYNYGFVECN